MSATQRILCLHGYHGSGAILQQQMRGLTAKLPDLTLTFVDAPSLARGDFGWWHDRFAGWERTRDWALSQLRAGQFDGVFGFSQGAALAGLLAAVQETDGPAGLFGFAIMVGGFTSPFPEHADLFRKPITLPSLHIVGRSDVVIPPRDSAALAARFADPEILQHPGGHVVPASGDIPDRVADFLRRTEATVSEPTQ